MITGDGIRLRAPEREDVPMFKSWLNDPAVREGILLYLPMSIAEEERWFEGMLARPPELHPMTIEIRMADGSWLAVGNCGFNDIDHRCASGEVGIIIGEKLYWNQGWGTKAMRLLVKHGFETLNLHRLYLHVFGDNQRAIRSYEKAGFVHEGTLRDDMYKHGRYIDVLVMSILRDEWKESESHAPQPPTP